ncbi:MAG: thioredoxin family protein [Aureispira sp.]
MNYWNLGILMSFLLLSIGSIAQPLKFERSNWETVKAKAKAENKFIFVDTYASWCEPCKWMDKHVFAKGEVSRFFGQHYISYKLDIEQGEGVAFAEEYRVYSYPTLLYFNPEGELVHRLIGAFEAKQLIQRSKDALKPENQIYTLKKRFEGGERDPAFLRQYVEALQAANEQYQSVADVYVQTVGLSALAMPDNFEFLEAYVNNDYRHRAYLYVASNRATFGESLTEKRVNNYLSGALNVRCYKLVENAASKAVIKTFLQDVKRLMPERLDYFKARIDFYYKRGNEKRDYRLALRYEKHCTDANSLNALARYMLDVHSGNKTQLNSALEWSNRAILLEETIYTLETKAMILMELGRKQEAWDVAKRQLELSKQENEHVEESEALLEMIETKG